MKKIYCTFYFLVAVGCVQFAAAQVPGYLGKRFIVQYDASAYLRFKSTAYISDVTKYGSLFGFNYRHNFCAEFVASNHLSLGVSFKKLRTSDYAVKQMRGSSSYDYDYFRTNMVADFYAVYFKLFSSRRKGSIAPIGFYNTIELAMAFTRGSIVQSNPYKIIPLSTYGVVPAKTLAFIYSFGKQDVVFNNFLLNYGMEFGFAPQGLEAKVNTALDIPERLTGNRVSDNQKLFNAAVKERLFNHLFMNVHAGIGFLIF